MVVESSNIAKSPKIAYYSHMEQPYTPDPFKNFTPRQNPVNQAVAAVNETIESIDLSALTDDELHQECKTSLVMMMRKAKGDLKALGAVRELLDRIEGKPVQRILEKTQRVDEVEAISNEERNRLADEEADRMLRLVYERSVKIGV